MSAPESTDPGQALAAAPAQAPATPEEPTPPRAQRGVPWRLVRTLIPLAVFLLCGLVGPAFVEYDEVATSTPDRLQPPGSEVSTGGTAWLGTDQVGRDVFAQVLQGARVSFLVGAVTVLVAGTAGSLLGIVAGYRGGWVDTVIMRFADVQLAIPSILLAILIAAVLGPSIANVIISLALTRWVFFARVARASALAVEGREFVDASRLIGASTPWILRHDVLPATRTSLMIVATLQFGLVIIAEASLSFLGLGTPPTMPSWGLTIANGRDYLATAWWISTMPGIALAFFMLALGRFGDALRDHFDPALRSLR